MIVLLRLVLLVASVGLLIVLLSPLAVLVNDLTFNPECLSIRLELSKAEYLGNNTLRVPVVVSYCSSVALTRVKLLFNTTEVSIPKLERGEYRQVVVLRLGDLLRSVEFRVWGLYRVVVRVVW